MLRSLAARQRNNSTSTLRCTGIWYDRREYFGEWGAFRWNKNLIWGQNLHLLFAKGYQMMAIQNTGSQNQIVIQRFCKFIFQLLKKIYVLKDFLLFKCLNVRPYDIVVIFPRISTIWIQLHLFCIQNVRKQIKRIFPVCLCHANLGE